jgi:hypothetical protein
VRCLFLLCLEVDQYNIVQQSWIRTYAHKGVITKIPLHRIPSCTSLLSLSEVWNICVACSIQHMLERSSSQLMELQSHSILLQLACLIQVCLERSEQMPYDKASYSWTRRFNSRSWFNSSLLVSE